jgi:hypothetical protein
MSKGENIFKRKDGRWEARYIKGYELSGKIKYGFCYGKTYREAKEKVTKCKAALVNGKPIPSTNSRHRFSFYCDEWLRMRKSKVKESTYIKYDTALRKHIKPKLGGCFPMGMTTGLIDDFTAELLFEDELAPKTVNDVLVVLHGILKYTATFFNGGFPAIEINYPKPGKKEMRVLSREEQTRFVSYLLDDMDTCKFGVLLTLFTGVRIGELCALQWGNIPSIDMSRHGFAAQKCAHTASSPLEIRQVFPAVLSLSGRISARQNCFAPASDGFPSDFWFSSRRRAGARQGEKDKKRRKGALAGVFALVNRWYP